VDSVKEGPVSCAATYSHEVPHITYMFHTLHRSSTSYKRQKDVEQIIQVQNIECQIFSSISQNFYCHQRCAVINVTVCHKTLNLA